MPDPVVAHVEFKRVFNSLQPDMSVAICANVGAQRPEYYVTLTNARGVRQRRYFATVRACANAVRRNKKKKWDKDKVSIRWC